MLFCQILFTNLFRRIMCLYSLVMKWERFVLSIFGFLYFLESVQWNIHDFSSLWRHKGHSYLFNVTGNIVG